MRGHVTRWIPTNDSHDDSPLLMLPVSRSDGRVRGDLVEGRVGHLIRAHLRRALDDTGQRPEHTGVRAAVIRVSVLFQIPHTDADRVRPARSDEGDFVLEPLLFSKHGNDVLVEELGELRRATRLEMEGNTSSKHNNLPGWRV